jgi:hypothetical protein
LSVGGANTTGLNALAMGPMGFGVGAVIAMVAVWASVGWPT